MYSKQVLFDLNKLLFKLFKVDLCFQREIVKHEGKEISQKFVPWNNFSIKHSFGFYIKWLKENKYAECSKNSFANQKYYIGENSTLELKRMFRF